MNKLKLQAVGDEWYWLIESNGQLIISGTHSYPTKDAAESAAREEWRLLVEGPLGVMEEQL